MGLSIFFSIGENSAKAMTWFLATSGTVFAGCVGVIYSKIHKIPFVIEFRDIAFEQMVATGMPRES